MNEGKVKKRIGFDLDGVLADHTKNIGKGDKNYIYGKASLDADVMAGAKETVQKLSENFELFVISRRRPNSRGYGLEWLKKYFDFVPENIFFVDKDEDKAGVIKKLGIDFYIDDKEVVLDGVKEPTKKFLFKKETGFDELLRNLK